MVHLAENTPDLKPTDLPTFAKAKETIKEHLKEYEQMGVALGYRSIAQFRAKLSKEQKGIINYSLSDLMEPSRRHQLDMAVLEVMTALGAEYKVGSPPASDAERRLQRSIDGLKAELGKTK